MRDYTAGKRGIIFDMDGVLWHSSSAHARAYCEALAELGIHDVEYGRLAGQRTDEAIRCELERRGMQAGPEKIERVTAAKRRLALRYLREDRPVAQSCHAALSDLRLRYRLGLASSASAASVRWFLEVSNTEKLFDAVITGEEVSAAKPAPDIYATARERLGIPSSQLLVVEDSIAGIQSGRRAGIDVLAITGTCDRATLAAEDVAGVIDRLEEIRPRAERVLTIDEAESTARGAIDPDLWTAVIPAAGIGSRLGFPGPKILYPVLERPILDWLLDFLVPCCSRFAFVLSPTGRAFAEPLISERLGGRAQVVVQHRPTGMADAVLLALQVVKTPFCCLVWGDQVLLSQRTLRACLSLHQQTDGAILSMPTVIKEEPYIHFQRDDADRIVAVQQAREHEIQSRFGENDCGLFAARSQPLFDILQHARQRRTAIGQTTGEFNLLQVIPEMERAGEGVWTIRIDDESETLGINTPTDAECAARILRRRRDGELGRKAA